MGRTGRLAAGLLVAASSAMAVMPQAASSNIMALKGLRLRGGADCLPIDKIRQALDKNKNEEHYIPAEPNPEDKKEASGSNRLCEQAERLRTLLEAKQQYDKSVHSINELFAAGLLSDIEQQKELKLANDALEKVRGVALKTRESMPMNKKAAQEALQAAIEKNDPAAMEAAVDQLKNQGGSADLYQRNLGHNWGAHTLGKVHMEHRLEEAIKNNDPAAIEHCVAELKKMEEMAEEDSCSISG